MSKKFPSVSAPNFIKNVVKFREAFAIPRCYAIRFVVYQIPTYVSQNHKTGGPNYTGKKPEISQCTFLLLPFSSSSSSSSLSWYYFVVVVFVPNIFEVLTSNSHYYQSIPILATNNGQKNYFIFASVPHGCQLLPNIFRLHQPIRIPGDHRQQSAGEADSEPDGYQTDNGHIRPGFAC